MMNFNSNKRILILSIIMFFALVTLLTIYYVQTSQKIKVLMNYNAIPYHNRLEEIPSVRDVFEYMKNPPAACYKLNSFGGKIHDLASRKTIHMDGDKLICENPAPVIPYGDCIVYSFGSNYDTSFEKQVQEKYKCEIFTFDPTLELNNRRIKNITYTKFFKIGMNSNDFVDKSSKEVYKSLKSIKQMLGHSNKRINILKMDIEGAEWDILKSLIGTKELDQIDHLDVEFHIRSVKEPVYLYPKLERMGFRLFSSRENKLCDPIFVNELGTHEYMLSELAFYKFS